VVALRDAGLEFQTWTWIGTLAVVDLRVGAHVFVAALEEGHVASVIQTGDDHAIASTPRTRSRCRSRT
jgi:hypothetical protein